MAVAFRILIALLACYAILAILGTASQPTSGTGRGDLHQKMNK